MPSIVCWPGVVWLMGRRILCTCCSQEATIRYQKSMWSRPETLLWTSWEERWKHTIKLLKAKMCANRVNSLLLNIILSKYNCPIQNKIFPKTKFHYNLWLPHQHLNGRIMCRQDGERTSSPKPGTWSAVPFDTVRLRHSIAKNIDRVDQWTQYFLTAAILTTAQTWWHDFTVVAGATCIVPCTPS